MKLSNAFLVLWLTLAGTAQAADPAFTLTAWVRKFVAVSARPFTVYNWVEREKVGTTQLGFGLPPTGPLDPRSPRLLAYLPEWSAYYFQTLKHGLYLGTDPVYYRGFGGEHPLLLRLRFRSGLRFLDFHTHYGDSAFSRIPSDAEAALVAQGCQVTHDDDFENLFRGEGYGSEQTPRCAEIVFRTMRELKIDAIQYKKGASNFNGVSRAKQDFAFVLTSTAWVKPGDAAFFYREMNDASLHAEQVQIEKRFLEVVGREADETAYYLSRRPWPELDAEARQTPDRLLGTEILIDE